MQSKTHLALGHYLLDREADAGLHRYRGLFLPGCIEPDYNLVTYLRGLRGHGCSMATTPPTSPPAYPRA